MSAEDPKSTDSRQDLPQPEPEKPSVATRWRYFSRRHAILAGLIIATVAIVVILLAFFLYRLGYVDRYIANQIKRTFSNYGIRAEIREFHADIPPQTVKMSGVELYDAQTGEKLGKIDEIDATIRIEDLYALNLRRNTVDFGSVAQTRNQRAVAPAVQALDMGNDVYDSVVAMLIWQFKKCVPRQMSWNLILRIGKSASRNWMPRWANSTNFS